MGNDGQTVCKKIGFTGTLLEVVCAIALARHQALYTTCASQSRSPTTPDRTIEYLATTDTYRCTRGFRQDNAVERLDSQKPALRHLAISRRG